MIMKTILKSFDFQCDFDFQITNSKIILILYGTKGQGESRQETSFFFIERFGEIPHHQQLYIKYFNMRQIKYEA